MNVKTRNNALQDCSLKSGTALPTSVIHDNCAGTFDVPNHRNPSRTDIIMETKRRSTQLRPGTGCGVNFVRNKKAAAVSDSRCVGQRVLYERALFSFVRIRRCSCVLRRRSWFCVGCFGLCCSRSGCRGFGCGGFAFCRSAARRCRSGRCSRSSRLG